MIFLRTYDLQSVIIFEEVKNDFISVKSERFVAYSYVSQR